MPIDPSPHGKEILHELPEERFPHPNDEGHPPHPKAPSAAQTRQRPPLPTHVAVMAADVEDEDDDPVIDTGPGIADGLAGARR
ncbi:MAG: hypothetical protein KIS62_19730 [Ramlibacter sp.]|nr:hypothetical protein [Ramlibacter sp.]